MPRVFISYRREDSIAYAGRIFDRLVSEFGVKNVFMDIDTLEPGVDFVEELQRTVQSCDVLLAILGMQWLTAKDEDGRLRLSNPEDFVVLEIGEALKKPTIRVIPILVGGARMPRSMELPEQLDDLARKHAVTLPDSGFHQVLGHLIQSIGRTEQERLQREPPLRPLPTVGVAAVAFLFCLLGIGSEQIPQFLPQPWPWWVIHAYASGIGAVTGGVFGFLFLVRYRITGWKTVFLGFCWFLGWTVMAHSGFDPVAGALGGGFIAVASIAMMHIRPDRVQRNHVN
jgi:hypothetical protein